MRDTTIYEIAEKAGVSLSTVSRVLNNYPHVKKATRAKVAKVLEECNFVPNETARSLVNRSSKMIGIFISDMRTTHHTEGVYHVEHEFFKNGYSCLIYNTGTDPKQQAAYLQILSQRKVEAVVLMGSIYQNEEMKQAIQSYLPSVPVAICNGFLDAPNVYGVLADEENGVSECVKLLSQRDRKHIAFITNHFTPSNRLKLSGFESGFSKFIQNGSATVIETGDQHDQIHDATIQLMKNKPETDGIVFAEDTLALVGLQALHEMDISVPSKVSVIGINNSKYAAISIPPLTSLDNMLYDTSIIAVRNLLGVLHGEYVNNKIVVCSKIIERQTT